MPDEMFFSDDHKSLRRGRRRRARTSTCRPCMLWPKDAPDMAFEGVVTDMSPYGLCVRMMEPVPPGTPIMLQLMRDERFSDPLATPLEGLIVRSTVTDEGFVDHGVQIQRAEFRRAGQSRPVHIERRRSTPYRRGGQSRMHTIDITIGDRGTQRSGR